jgi:hypothetical protein
VSNQDLARVRVGQVSDLGSDLSSELVITEGTVIDRRPAFDTYTTRSLYFHQKVSTRILKLEFLA